MNARKESKTLYYQRNFPALPWRYITGAGPAWSADETWDLGPGLPVNCKIAVARLEPDEISCQRLNIERKKTPTNPNNNFPKLLRG